MNDFKAEPPELREAELGAVRRVLESGWYVLGEEVAAFEEKWAAICGVAYGVGVGNGMDAIELALRAVDIRPGDEVITTSMTAFATVLGILRAGATPVLADIEPGTALMSIESAARCISVRTKALVLVHLYGQVRMMSDWQAFCTDQGIELIEDCAQAHLATWNGKVAGSFGAAGAYSFYPTKNLGARGDAGMVVTDNGQLSKRVRCLRNYGQSTRYHHSDLGMNSRLDEIHAAMLSQRLRWLPAFTDARRRIAGQYRAEISNGKVGFLDAPEEPSAHVYHLFVISSEQRDALLAHLWRRNVQALIHYPVPIHWQKPCKGIRHDPNGLAASERHAGTCLSLPCHPQMTGADVAEVIAAANAFGA